MQHNQTTIATASTAGQATDPMNTHGIAGLTVVELFDPARLGERRHGWVVHPDLPEFEKGEHYAYKLALMGFDCRLVTMENDPAVSQEMRDDYFVRNSCDISHWNPSDPVGEDWVVAAIYDSEDGPCALFVRAVGLLGSHTLDLSAIATANLCGTAPVSPVNKTVRTFGYLQKAAQPGSEFGPEFSQENMDAALIAMHSVITQAMVQRRYAGSH